ncbi:MAG TPA: glycosyl hydrolase family 79 C-terminal domain-containing protein [Solirubrobacteraceae bacterium]|nr:glycosyl hydrolase family 79 C-terminal domain-containing protein [Solirubrobacteraceae bacterium]
MSGGRLAAARSLIAAALACAACAALAGCGAAAGGPGSSSAAGAGGSGGAAVTGGETPAPGPAADPAAGGSSAALSAAAGGAAAASGAGTEVLAIGPRVVGRPIPSGYLGLSFEFQAVRAYTGADPSRIDPVLLALIRNLTPGQAPVLRIGGDSTDISYVPARGVRPPAFASYALTPSWLATTAALARQLGARMIMGINLAADEPALAAAEARAFKRALGDSIQAFEIGNEPNVYSKLPIMRTVFGLPVPARPPGFGYPAYARQLGAEAAAVAAADPGADLAGPALAVGPTAPRGSWLHVLPALLAHDRRLAIVTVHRYPLRNCFVPPSSPQYPSIPHLLSDYATAGLAASLRPWLAIARRQHRQLRVDELNSVACRGKSGVSDTFAAALWAPDALFSLARAGVDGVDVHTLPGSAYQLFKVRRVHGLWEAHVEPVYYGLQLFAQAAPPGSRLLAVSAGPDRAGRRGMRGLPATLSAWATRARDGTLRILLIDKSASRSRTVILRLAPGAGPVATVERMLAPSVSSRGGVTLGGRSYGAETATGVLGAPLDSSVPVAAGRVTVTLPAASAALVTVAPG